MFECFSAQLFFQKTNEALKGKSTDLYLKIKICNLKFNMCILHTKRVNYNGNELITIVLHERN